MTKIAPKGEVRITRDDFVIALYCGMNLRGRRRMYSQPKEFVVVGIDIANAMQDYCLDTRTSFPKPVQGLFSGDFELFFNTMLEVLQKKSMVHLRVSNTHIVYCSNLETAQSADLLRQICYRSKLDPQFFLKLAELTPKISK